MGRYFGIEFCAMTEKARQASFVESRHLHFREAFSLSVCLFFVLFNHRGHLGSEGLKLACRKILYRAEALAVSIARFGVNCSGCLLLKFALSTAVTAGLPGVSQSVVSQMLRR